MTKRSIRDCHLASRDDIEDLVTRRPLPNPKLQALDPFLFLNHHGPQIYPKNNQGLPFGPHPHRGFETVTFILSGELAHQDSSGGESVIRAGGVQWMTAGRGLVHSEISPKSFLKEGGRLEILQLWVNLPAKLKMTEPKYQGVQANEIPKIKANDGLVEIDVVAGQMENTIGPFHPLTGLELSLVRLKPGGEYELKVSRDETVFFYTVTGSVEVNGTQTNEHQLIEFADDGDAIGIRNLVAATQDACILFGHGKAFKEPIVSYGPFVMNTNAEIEQAIFDYQAGKFK